MTVKINQTFLLWCISVCQPVRWDEAVWAFRSFTNAEKNQIERREVDAQIKILCERDLLIKFNKDRQEYLSTTYNGHLQIPRNLRHLRDKIRLHLLNKSRRQIVTKSREVIDEGLDGDSPSSDTSRSLKGRAANVFWPPLPSAKRHWPRLLRQLRHEAGSYDTSREPIFQLVSFATWDQLKKSGGQAASWFGLTAIDLSVALGISLQLIERLRNNPSRFYRTFELPKKGGGKRVIKSPRSFLKVPQSFLSDYVLTELKVHETVHSYKAGAGIISNASQHCGRGFLASIDIKDFFGSINRDRLDHCLRKNGFTKASRNLVLDLCMLDNGLPQGAPSSPILSNAFLFDFDKFINNYCIPRNMNYTRYADDICISGDSKVQIQKVLSLCERLLISDFGLSLRSDKTRIASRFSQQRVTGVVVNERPLPPRQFRRRVRAMIHNAQINGTTKEEKRKLLGYVSYLSSFSELKEKGEIERYQLVLPTIRVHP